MQKINIKPANTSSKNKYVIIVPYNGTAVKVSICAGIILDVHDKFKFALIDFKYSIFFEFSDFTLESASVNAEIVGKIGS